MENTLYEFPNYELLERSNVKNIETDIQDKKKIEKFFHNFNIYVECKEIYKGINYTTYAVNLKSGTKISDIKKCKQDLIMEFMAVDIQFEISIGGTSCLGITIIKEKDRPLLLGDLISNEELKKTKCKIPIVLGVDFRGEFCIEDLTEMPNLLIAGSTGTGKSTFLATIIVNILYKFNPDEIKLVLVDTRATNFLRFNKIPHLYTPVIIDYDETVVLLKQLIKEMIKRYEIFEGKNVNNINEYNKISENKMPGIVLIIEDLYDLMVENGNEIEKYIKMLTQSASNSGIYLIISTQRPSTDVITGTIKANMPARIAFFVPSYIDSKTIIDEAGAEKLQVNGDIIFSKTDARRKKRIQTPYISDREIQKIIDCIGITTEEHKSKMIIKSADDEKDNKAEEKNINFQEENETETSSINEIKDEKSIFEKWWFWLLTIIFILIIIGNI